MEIILPLFYLCFENAVNNAIVVPGSLTDVQSVETNSYVRYTVVRSQSLKHILVCSNTPDITIDVAFRQKP